MDPAINRFRIVVDNYETTIYVEEAIHRLVEIYYILGIETEAKKYANLLGYNYQSSQWYEKSFILFNKNYKTKNIEKEDNPILKNLNLYLIEMNKNKILSDYKKIKSLIEYNKSYYDANKSLVTDKEYDELKKDILILESNYSF